MAPSLLVNQWTDLPLVYVLLANPISKQSLHLSDDSLDDMTDNFLNEFNKFDLYELLSEASQNTQLRQDLNERYLSDYLNMVYAAQSNLEFQVGTGTYLNQVSLSNTAQD